MGDQRHQLLLDKLANSLEVYQVPLQRCVLNLEDIEKPCETKLQVFNEDELCHAGVKHDSHHLDVAEESVVLQYLSSCNLVIDQDNLIQELEAKVSADLLGC